ncbi:hypothetical protein [Streptomyces sp. NPDC047014]
MPGPELPSRPLDRQREDQPEPVPTHVWVRSVGGGVQHLAHIEPA